MPSNNVHLAWAVPVDPLQTIASLFAFASCKAALTTFRLCARSVQVPSPGLSQLPLEIILSIEDYVLSSCRATELDRLSEPFECLTNGCTPKGHLSEDEIAKLRDRCVTSAQSLLHVASFIISITHTRTVSMSTCLRVGNLTVILRTTGSW